MRKEDRMDEKGGRREGMMMKKKEKRKEEAGRKGRMDGRIR